jgi:tetratricopeptide (TPR) repeat protein
MNPMKTRDQKWYEAGSVIKNLSNEYSGQANLGYLSRRKLLLAIAKLLRIEHEEPENWRLHFMLGMGFLLTEARNDSYKHFKLAVQYIDEDDPSICRDVYREASIDANRQGLGIEAEQFVNKALGFAPNDPELLANKALTLLTQQQIDEASDLISTSLKALPNDPLSRNVENLINSVRQGKQPCPTKI